MPLLESQWRVRQSIEFQIAGQGKRSPGTDLVFSALYEEESHSIKTRSWPYERSSFSIPSLPFSDFPQRMVQTAQQILSGPREFIQTLVQERIVQIIERETCNTVLPARTRFIPYDEFAAYCDCTIRAVEYAISNLLKRGVVDLVEKNQR